MAKKTHEPKMYSKTELVDLVTEKLSLHKTEATKNVNAIFDSLKEILEAGDGLRLVGFGTFAVKERAAREGRNPSTGEALKIPAKKIVTFRPSKALIVK
jgi:DNA-binding protein HU-beta